MFLILSLLDGASTLWGLGQGAIEELNPVMRWLIEENPIVFMTVKLSLPVMLGFVLWEIRQHFSLYHSQAIDFTGIFDDFKSVSYSEFYKAFVRHLFLLKSEGKRW